jgi:transposase-like protein
MEQSEFITQNDLAALNQGQYGLTILEDLTTDFSADFLDEAYCRSWVLGKLHPAGAACPECGRSLTEKQETRFWSNKRLQCSGCGKWFNALAGTFFHKTRFTFPEIVLLLVFLGMNQPTVFIAEKLKVDQETVRAWRHKFSEAGRSFKNFR